MSETAQPVRRRRSVKRRNERVKLLSSAFDRVSTLIVAGAILAPVFQSHSLTAGIGPWLLAAISLHLGAQGILFFFEEES